MSSTVAEHVPETPEELTPAWLQHTLGWHVDTVEREILGAGQGFLGDIVRLSLTGHGADAPDSCIVKIPKKANRAMGEMLGVYEREVLFFREMAGSVPVRTPEIYYSHYDHDADSAKQKEILKVFDGLPRFLNPMIAALGRRIAAAKKRRYLLVMEDLGALEAGDQLTGTDEAHCALVLDAIAESHRKFWNAPELDDRFWLLPLDLDARMRHGMFLKQIPAYRAHLEPALQPILDWLAGHGDTLMQTLTREAPATLIHCDLRLDNVCFASDGCTFIDWQLTRAGPAAYDVAYFVSSALAPEASPEVETRLLERYHQRLDVPDYPFERFLRDYRRGLLLTLPSLAPNEDIEIDAGRGQEMMARWRARLAARLAGIDPATLL